tara:strand:+ start:897 stop:1127 length:231 start_codon:yes stop_codon:yes gene_type:complete
MKTATKRFNSKEYILITNAYKISNINESKKEYKAKGYTEFVITEKPRTDCNLPNYQLWGVKEYTPERTERQWEKGI